MLCMLPFSSSGFFYKNSLICIVFVVVSEEEIYLVHSAWDVAGTWGGNPIISFCKPTGIKDKSSLWTLWTSAEGLGAESQQRHVKQDTVEAWWRGTVKCVGQEWDSPSYKTSANSAGRQPGIEEPCWPVAKLQLNSFSIIITICFPYRPRAGGGWDQAPAAASDSVLFSVSGGRSIMTSPLSWFLPLVISDTWTALRSSPLPILHFCFSYLFLSVVLPCFSCLLNVTFSPHFSAQSLPHWLFVFFGGHSGDVAPGSSGVRRLVGPLLRSRLKCLNSCWEEIAVKFGANVHLAAPAE